MIRITFKIIPLLLLCSTLSRGQGGSSQYPGVNIISPSATALAKYVDFPVNLHSGVPQINLPIYTVKEGPLELPIAFSYHASGLKVQESASWVGAGWSLESGGVVSRTINGLPDEKKGYDGFSFLNDKGYSNYFFYSDSSFDYRNFLNGHKDGEPDLFTFTFGGYGGKFYLREDFTPVLIPEADLKIETVLKPGVNTSSTLDYIQGFKITVPDGVKYYFGVTASTSDVDPIEKSSMRTSQDGTTFSTVISSWYLYKIESADNAFTININYRSEGYSYYNVSTKPCIPDCNYSITPVKMIVEGVALRQIQFTNGSVEFISNNLRLDVGSKDYSEADIANTEAKSLDEIQIKSNDASQCTSYKLQYGYFENNSTLSDVVGRYSPKITDKKRLKLNKIQQFSCDNSTSVSPYEFYYYDEGMVPRRLSLGQDHWGFYNGAESNTTLIPLLSIDAGSSYKDDREARWPQMRAGALKMIQYPTGGSTEYVYEPNRVTTLSGCTFQTNTSSPFGLSAGMGGPQAEYGQPQTLEVSTASLYYFQVTAQNGGSGKFYIDNDLIATVNAGSYSFGDYLYLNAGTYDLKAFANGDSGSGVGITVMVYSALATSCTSREKTVGGLRIKAINKFASPGVSLSMRYDYESPILYSIPAYIFKMKNEILKGNANWPTENGCAGFSDEDRRAMYYTSPVSVQPLQSVQGTHIGYKRVKEIQADGGYSLYEYNGTFNMPANWRTLEDVSVRKIDVTVCTASDPSYPFAPLPYDPQRGFLKLQQTFDKDNVRLKEIVYSQQYEENKVGGLGVTTGVYPVQGTNLANHYELKSGKMKWTQQTERTFDRLSGKVLEKETKSYFNSAYHDMPSAKTQTSQNGLSETRYRYVPDLTQCNYECTSCLEKYRKAVAKIDSIYSVNVENCRIGVCYENKFKGAKDSQGNWFLPPGPCMSTPNDTELKKNKCTAASWNDYQYRLNEVRVAYTTCINSCKQNNNCLISGINNSSNPAEVKALFQMEQANRLEVIESTVWKEGNLLSAIFFDYKPATTDPDKIYLKNVFSTEINQPVITFSPATIVSASVQRDTHYSADPVVTYQFKNGQPVEIRERNGAVASYIWGFNNTVPLVKTIGSSYDALQAAYANSPTDFRNNPSLSKAQITSYTYSALQDMISVTDANGRLVYYEYDKLGRLIVIRDNNGKILEEYQYSYRTN